MKQILIKYTPSIAYKFFKKARYFYFDRIKGFKHGVAQDAELVSAKNYMKVGNKYLELVHDLDRLKDRKISEDLISDISYIKTFFNDTESYRKFFEEMENKRCLEIGTGPIGLLPLLPWIKDRIVVDPLINGYKEFQLGHFGKTFFTNDMQVYSQAAETYISELEGSVDGLIFSRNALDHCDDPWLILKNISRYSAPGCKLLLWTDLWHLKDIDTKHRNIVKDKNVFENKLIELGFKIERSFSDVRDVGSTIEYGCIAIKV